MKVFSIIMALFILIAVTPFFGSQLSVFYHGGYRSITWVTMWSYHFSMFFVVIMALFNLFDALKGVSK